jgi:thiol-disulfide isomerase/thioredoxin
MSLTHTPRVHSGWPLPTFSLPGLDGKTYTDKSFSNAKALWVMFICNHCPYVKAIENRLLKIALLLQERGCNVVAICSNDATDYPEDSFENLKKNWEVKKFSFPYLWDESQEVAKKFGAVCTPDFYLFDDKNELVYRGQLDDSWKNESLVKSEDLKQAALALCKGQKLSGPQTPSMGCSIKWKKL